jgi:phage shock protein PspC (stress-responsive transcriptional regulator)
VTGVKERLYRSKEDAMIGGVAAGLADYFEVDVTLIRLIWLLLVFVGGAGVLTYIIAWIVIPEESTRARPPIPGAEDEEGVIPQTTEELPDSERVQQRRRTAGVILVVIGLIFLLNETLTFFPDILRRSWPLALVLAGAYLVFDAARGRE